MCSSDLDPCRATQASPRSLAATCSPGLNADQPTGKSSSAILSMARRRAWDGSCLGNPGPGGWACILRFGAIKKELFGYDAHTTNNRMELMAAIQGLLAFKEPCEVEITTDAEYVRQGIRTVPQCGSAGVDPVCSARMKLANPELVSHARRMR